MMRGVRIEWLVVLALALAPLAGPAQTMEGPRLPRGAAPAAPVYSSDGTVTVLRPGTRRVPYAGVDLVTQFSAELQRVLRLKLGTQLAPLEVAIGGKSDGDTRVLTARLRDAGGVVRERISCRSRNSGSGSVPACDLRGVAAGWMVEAGGTEATMQDVPAWLIDGLLRYIDRGGVKRTLIARCCFGHGPACRPPPRWLRRTARRRRVSLRSLRCLRAG